MAIPEITYDTQVLESTRAPCLCHTNWAIAPRPQSLLNSTRMRENDRKWSVSWRQAPRQKGQQILWQLPQWSQHLRRALWPKTSNAPDGRLPARPWPAFASPSTGQPRAGSPGAWGSDLRIRPERSFNISKQMRRHGPFLPVQKDITPLCIAEVTKLVACQDRKVQTQQQSPHPRHKEALSMCLHPTMALRSWQEAPEPSIHPLPVLNGHAPQVSRALSVNCTHNLRGLLVTLRNPASHVSSLEAPQHTAALGPAPHRSAAIPGLQKGHRTNLFWRQVTEAVQRQWLRHVTAVEAAPLLDRLLQLPQLAVVHFICAARGPDGDPKR